MAIRLPGDRLVLFPLWGFEVYNFGKQYARQCLDLNKTVCSVQSISGLCFDNQDFPSKTGKFGRSTKWNTTVSACWSIIMWTRASYSLTEEAPPKPSISSGAGFFFIS